MKEDRIKAGTVGVEKGLERVRRVEKYRNLYVHEKYSWEYIQTGTLLLFI